VFDWATGMVPNRTFAVWHVKIMRFLIIIVVLLIMELLNPRTTLFVFMITAAGNSICILIKV
jgi:hypothetical protein